MPAESGGGPSADDVASTAFVLASFTAGAESALPAADPSPLAPDDGVALELPHPTQAASAITRASDRRRSSTGFAERGTKGISGYSGSVVIGLRGQSYERDHPSMVLRVGERTTHRGRVFGSSPSIMVGG
jgi:hypothetical protein